MIPIVSFVVGVALFVAGNFFIGYLLGLLPPHFAVQMTLSALLAFLIALFVASAPFWIFVLTMVGAIIGFIGICCGDWYGRRAAA